MKEHHDDAHNLSMFIGLGVALGAGIGATPSGFFRVVRLLPDTQGRNQYRVESTSDGHQRVAVESEIALQRDDLETDVYAKVRIHIADWLHIDPDTVKRESWLVRDLGLE